MRHLPPGASERRSAASSSSGSQTCSSTEMASATSMLAAGSVADITVLAPDAHVTIHAAALRSKSKNTPFDGWQLRGATAATIVGGRTVFANGDVAGAEVFA